MTTSTTRDLLVAARALLTDPAHWTQGSYARDAAGEPTQIRANAAVRWCAIGAVVVVSPPGLPRTESDRASDALHFASHELFNDSTTHVNDDRGHAAVLRVYDSAIAAQPL